MKEYSKQLQAFHQRVDFMHPSRQLQAQTMFHNTLRAV